MSYFLVPPLRRILPGYFEVLGLAGHRFVWTHPSLSEHVQSCLNTSKPACVKVSEFVWLCPNMSKMSKPNWYWGQKCQDKSGHVWKSLDMSGHVWKSLDMSGHVWPCLVWVQFEGAWAKSAWGRSSYKRWQVTTILHRLGGE